MMIKNKGWINRTISPLLGKIIKNHKLTKRESDHLTLKRALNGYEGYRRIKREINYTNHLLKEKEEKYSDLLDYERSLQDQIKEQKSHGMLKYGKYIDLR